MSSSRARLSVPVALALALAAPGCAEDLVTIPGDTLRVRLTEYRLEPQDVRVPAGRLRIEAINAGRLTHNVRIVRTVEGGSGRTGDEIGGTPTSQPGQMVTGAARIAPGEYRIICSIANHDDLGMYGKLVAEER